MTPWLILGETAKPSPTAKPGVARSAPSPAPVQRCFCTRAVQRPFPPTFTATGSVLFAGGCGVSLLGLSDVLRVLSRSSFLPRVHLRPRRGILGSFTRLASERAPVCLHCLCHLRNA